MFTFNLALRPTRFSAYSTRTSRALLSSRRFYSTSPAACPSCSTPLPTALPTCPKCSHIEPLPASTSYHDIFGLQANPNPFIVDTKELKSRFLQAQRVCHPDAWSRKGEKEHAIAAAQSSQLNKAYQTLLSPLQRAHYILAQHGLPPSETDKLTEKVLIMEVMDAREELEEATSVEEVEEVRLRNQERMRETNLQLERLIGEQKWEEASSAAVRLKYWEGIENAAREWRR